MSERVVNQLVEVFPGSARSFVGTVVRIEGEQLGHRRVTVMTPSEEVFTVLDDQVRVITANEAMDLV